MTTIAGMTLSLMLNAAANEGEEAPTPAAQDGGVDASPTQPPHTYPRSVYKVDDIGMIIGGASEDAKAKVGRLPILD
jgi:hypothetical protein